MAGKTDSYIPFFGRDFLTSTMGWTAEERGHYVVLLVTQWEQGSIFADAARLELVSPGITTCWEVVGAKFPMCSDGQRRNQRLEEHRAKADELKSARAAAGAAGNRKRWGGIANGSQTDRKSIANGIANGIAKASPPSPSPSPSEMEEHSLRSCSAPSETRKPRSRSKPSDSIRWTPAAGWEGIEASDRTAWSAAYPACDLDGELARMGEWLKSNPAKAHKSRWRAFVVSWLTRSQDRGGGQPSNRPGAPAAQPVTPSASRKYFRADAHRSMTDAEYAAWRGGKGPGGIVLGIAAALVDTTRTPAPPSKDSQGAF